MQPIHSPAASDPHSYSKPGLSRFRTAVLPASNAAAALIIVLSFIVLLAGLIIAFFSRAVLDRQISNSSASQIKTEIFAQGAADQIIGDLKQEIVDGSTATAVTGGTIYLPKAGSSAIIKSTIVPALAGSTGTGGLENLVKRSASGVPFYDNSNSNYAALGRKRAINVNSATNASANNRSVSLARWNKPLLLTKKDSTITNDTDFTPVASYTAPDWILVARDGSNPTTWSANMIATNSSTTTAVTGRYAYNIYDEGGLLDVNAAGYPSTASLTQSSYKNSLAYADLTQLKFTDSGGTTQQLLTAAQSDNLVGWRNYASASTNWTATPPTLGAFPLTGTFPGAGTAGWTSAAGSNTNYYNFTMRNTKGFLNTANPVLNAGQSDRVFNSRQQLIKLLIGGLATNVAERAKLQNALQYLTHFTRDLNQPTFIPDAARPRMKAGTAGDPAIFGGNAAGTDDAGDLINVSFPATRVTASFTRNDGSTAKVGEPLVKKRFALNRLGWLTYLGPIADDSGNITAATTAIYNSLVNSGIDPSLLKQGGPANIQKYFGLIWQADTHDGNRSKWFYNVHNGGSGIIRELGGGTNGINGNPHDPDFFELLKAGVQAGSKGKTMVYLGGATMAAMAPDAFHPWREQYGFDVSLDYSIIQIGANIIDQFDVDGYSSSIVFDVGGGVGPKEIRGVENYPYFYRVRLGTMKLRVPNGGVPDVADKEAVAGPVNTTTYPTFTDTGVGVVMHVPEIWNPHDINAPLGSPYPAKFRMIVDSADPATIYNVNNSNNSGATTTGYSRLYTSGYDTVANAPINNVSSNNSATTTSPVNFTILKNGGGAQITGGYNNTPALLGARELTALNTALTFDAATAGSTLYREPTLLARPLVPAGSNLALGWDPVALGYDISKIQDSGNNLAYTGTGFRTETVNPLALPTAPATSQPYLGIVLGLYPIQWVIPHNLVNNIYVAGSATLGGTPNTYLTYRMQYKDPAGNWVTYDEKYICPVSVFLLNNPGGLVVPLNGNTWGQSGCWQSFADPRSSRFGTVGSDNNNFATVTSPQKWLDATNGVLASDRPDYFAGFLFETYRPPSGPYDFKSNFAPGWSTSSGGSASTATTFRFGPLSQNAISTTTGTGWRFLADAAGAGPSSISSYYADADGVVRRSMGGLNPWPTSGTSTIGLPMATATTTYGATATQSQSRPYILNRPFRSVGELGYVFSGTPWKNIDFFTPESGDSALLDIFSIKDTSDANGLVAGKVSLNTRQGPVLAAILAGAYKDVANVASGPIGTTGTPSEAATVADKLIKGAAGTTGTSLTGLMNIGELVGKYTGTSQTSGTMGLDGSTLYMGFSADLSSVYSSGSYADPSTNYIQRLREAPLRTLSNVGTTRVWNLMIDIVAQTGKYPVGASAAAQFVVEGERRYWVHVSMDRYTGQILDRQIEEVKE